MKTRNELAKRIKQFRAVDQSNDPTREYRKMANKCRKGDRSYHRTFGLGKKPKKVVLIFKGEKYPFKFTR